MRRGPGAEAVPFPAASERSSTSLADELVPAWVLPPAVAPAVPPSSVPRGADRGAARRAARSGARGAARGAAHSAARSGPRSAAHGMLTGSADRPAMRIFSRPRVLPVIRLLRVAPPRICAVRRCVRFSDVAH
jgi:hypothetical protein